MWSLKRFPLPRDIPLDGDAQNSKLAQCLSTLKISSKSICKFLSYAHKTQTQNCISFFVVDTNKIQLYQLYFVSLLLCL